MKSRIPVKVGECATFKQKTWRRIRREAARRAYQNGSAVMYCGAGLHPADPRNNPFVLLPGVVADSNFDNAVWQYVASGNCQDKAGPYPAFYIKVKV